MKSLNSGRENSLFTKVRAPAPEQPPVEEAPVDIKKVKLDLKKKKSKEKNSKEQLIEERRSSAPVFEDLVVTEVIEN